MELVPREELDADWKVAARPRRAWIRLAGPSRLDGFALRLVCPAQGASNVEGVPIDFAVLGPLEVRLDGASVDLGTPLQRILLAYLLTEPNHPVSVERIADLLWTGEPSEQALANIQSYVSRLRRVLEPTRTTRARSDVLVTRTPGYAVMIKPDQLDSARFDQLLNAARAQAEMEPAAALRDVEAALSLWRGPAFSDLANLRPVAEAVRLDERRIAARELRVELLVAIGRFREAVPEALALAQSFPLREHAQQLAIVSLARTGRHADAMRVAATARESLLEVGLSASPEFAALERAVLDHDSSLEPPSMPSLSVIERTPALSGANASLARDAYIPFVGREAETARVGALFSGPNRDDFTLVVLRGPAGIGKTRLATQLAKLAGDSSDARSAWGRCTDLDVPVPLWPIAQMMNDLDLDPLVATSSVSDPATLLPTIGRTRLLEAATRRIGALPALVGAPVVLIFDDVQWADPESLLVLASVAHERPAGVSVILTERTIQHDGESFSGGFTNIRHALGAIEVELAPLELTDVTRLSEAILGQGLEPTLTNAIHARTGGNPFYAVELLGALRSNVSLDAATQHVPPLIRDVTAHRLSRLPSACRTVLQVAAANGDPFDLSVVARVTGLADETVLDLAEITLVAGLTDDRHGWRFAHQIVADAIVAGLSSTRRARLHNQIADALEPGTTAAELAAIAHHRVRALSVAGPSPAIEALERAEAASAAGFAYDTAIELNETTIRIMKLVVDTPTSRERHLQVVLRGLQWASIRHGFTSPHTRAAFERAARATEQNTDINVTARILRTEAMTSLLSGDVDRAALLGDRLIALAVQHEDHHVSVVANQDAAMYAFHVGDLEKAGTHIRWLDEQPHDQREQALAAYFASGDEQDVLRNAIRAACDALSSYSSQHFDASHFDGVWRTARTLIGRAYVAVFAATTTALLEQFDQVGRWVDLLGEAADEGNLTLFAAFGDALAAVARVGTNPPDAQLLATEAERITMQLACSLGTHLLYRPSLLILAKLYLRAGLASEALAALDRYEAAVGSRIGDAFTELTRERTLAQLRRPM